jgi:hypothetical protein
VLNVTPAAYESCKGVLKRDTYVIDRLCDDAASLRPHPPPPEAVAAAPSSPPPSSSKTRPNVHELVVEPRRHADPDGMDRDDGVKVRVVSPWVSSWSCWCCSSEDNLLLYGLKFIVVVDVVVVAAAPLARSLQ